MFLTTIVAKISLLKIFFAESDWKLWQTRELFLNNYIPHKRGQLWKVRRQACIVVYSLLFGGCQFWKPHPFSQSKSIKLLYDCKKSFPFSKNFPCLQCRKHLSIFTSQYKLPLLHVARNIYSPGNMKLKKQYCFGTFCDTKILFAWIVKPI